jgi:hypothetical protein
MAYVPATFFRSSARSAARRGARGRAGGPPAACPERARRAALARRLDPIEANSAKVASGGIFWRRTGEPAGYRDQSSPTPQDPPCDGVRTRSAAPTTPAGSPMSPAWARSPTGINVADIVQQVLADLRAHPTEWENPTWQRPISLPWLPTSRRVLGSRKGARAGGPRAFAGSPAGCHDACRGRVATRPPTVGVMIQRWELSSGVVEWREVQVGEPTGDGVGGVQTPR